MQDRIVDRPDLQLDAARVGELLGERNLVPGKARLAHVDGRDQRVPLPFQQLSRPACVSKVSASLPVSRNISSAMQRMPLPQAPAGEPSLL
jgi:hypothetical protein